MGATTTGAEKLLQAAVEEGIEICFANPGTMHAHTLSRGAVFSASLLT